ncbi:MAG TPA: efflux RND transporter periplasmic adaptor subunit [Polyangiaceae bacterium]
MHPERESSTESRLGNLSRVWRVALASVLAVCGCERGSASPERSQAPVPVSVQPVVRADVPVEVRAIGTVEAVSTVAIVPQVTGRVTSIHFAEGAAVRKNDPLFSIDTRPYNATLAAAQAELQKSRALAEEAKVEAQRYQALVREGLATAQEAARREADKKSTAASVEAAEAQIASASLNVQFSTVRSPIDGRTGQVLVHAGNVVHAGDTAPMVVVRSLTPVKVVFTISQDLLPRLRERFSGGPLPVRATPRGGGARSSAGELSFIDNSVDAATGMLTLKATFPNQDEALWPGSFVDVVLVLDEEQGAIVAPEAAVAEGQQGPYAFVVDGENKARLRRVTLKRRTESRAIVASGLAPGDRVVVDGLVRLKEGTNVRVQPDVPAKADRAGTEDAAASGSGS